MAKDDKGNDGDGKGPDAKAVKKSAKLNGDSISDMLDLSKDLVKTLQDADKLNDLILKQVQDNNQKEQQERFKAMQDLHEKIFTLIQEVTENKKKMEKTLNQWDEYVRN